jgi:cytochrome c biogenesis protein CcmG, thiol:disulfide interchange protein DsbE
MSQGAAARAAAVLLCLLPVGAAQAMAVGDPVPDFARTSLQGGQVSLYSLRGKLVLLSFWATWCAPCREELPAFSKWQQAYGARGLRVIGVSMDDEVEPVRRYLAVQTVAFPVVMGDAQLGARFGGVLGLPLSYLIGADGRVLARFQGEPRLGEMESQIRSHLLPRPLPKR